ncbi:MAG: CBS domain-containing protein [Acidobacteria bacterium]|nr:MAG: CBS domain-containing protein [Acidobacteriota bacterium]REJ98412.1 MAG: CBS domain-containing protein [Acidobacteriota bacterium]REK17158.1 MAG: CBS domain-containing protein [Acidobacteriota bacterium]REK43068.1 MAG: CBS domain-containing protein [Acidobacteriota bacterium]
MKLVKHLLENKGNQIWSIEPDRSVLDAIKMMAEKGIGALLVMEGHHLTGIVSERDYARKVILQGRSSDKTEVREIMTDKVFSTGPDNSVEECMTVMTRKRIRHLPVVEGNSVIGVLSIGDLVKAKIEEQEHQIEQLQNYITT